MKDSWAVCGLSSYIKYYEQSNVSYDQLNCSVKLRVSHKLNSQRNRNFNIIFSTLLTISRIAGR